MYTEIGDTLVVDIDQEGDLTLVIYDSDTDTWHSYGLSFDEAEFFSDRVQEVIQQGRELREANQVQ